jgi:putative tryptophan/tyrosine transport system substrate-binding protein
MVSDWTRARLDASPSDIKAELVALADLIIAAGVGVVTAVQAASRAVPIVFAQAIDPVGAGVVVSLARPGGMRPE